MIDYPEPGHVGITSRGRTIVTYILNDGHKATRLEAVKTLEQLQHEWLAYLGPSRSSLLEPLLEQHPEDMTREELARRSGRSSRSSAFDDALAQMRKIGLIEYPGRGRVRAAELLPPKDLHDHTRHEPMTHILVCNLPDNQQSVDCWPDASAESGVGPALLSWYLGAILYLTYLTPKKGCRGAKEDQQRRS